MKILIATDMEGITGVTSSEHVTPGSASYPRFCKLMTQDINAAIRGAFEAGATDVIVADGHNLGENVLIEELDPRARLNTGNHMPLSMVQGIDQGVDGVFFVGYHARAGSKNGVLDHTWSSKHIAGLWINGQEMGEYGLNGAVCGHFNVPVLMLTGDQTVCAQARELLGEIETVEVKQALGRYSAECLAPAITSAMISAAAARAVRRLSDGQAPTPLQITGKVRLEIAFLSSDMAAVAAVLLGAEPLDGRRICIEVPDMLAAYHTFRLAVSVQR